MVLIAGNWILEALLFVTDSVHNFHGQKLWNQGANGVWFGGVRISSLLFADDVFLLASSGGMLQLSL